MRSRGGGVWGLVPREVTAAIHPFLFLTSPVCRGLVEVSTRLYPGVWCLSLQPSVMNCSCDFLSAAGYGSSPRIFHSCLRLIPGCLSKLSSPNLSSEKKDGREAGEESSLELHPPVWQQGQARPWSMEAAVRSGHLPIPLPLLHYARQSQGWGKVWVFGGAAVLPMSGPFNFSFWTFDQIL